MRPRRPNGKIPRARTRRIGCVERSALFHAGPPPSSEIPENLRSCASLFDVSFRNEAPLAPCRARIGPASSVRPSRRPIYLRHFARAPFGLPSVFRTRTHHGRDHAHRGSEGARARPPCADRRRHGRGRRRHPPRTRQRRPSHARDRRVHHECGRQAHASRPAHAHRPSARLRRDAAPVSRGHDRTSPYGHPHARRRGRRERHAPRPSDGQRPLGQRRRGTRGRLPLHPFLPNDGEGGESQGDGGALERRQPPLRGRSCCSCYIHTVTKQLCDQLCIRSFAASWAGAWEL